MIRVRASSLPLAFRCPASVRPAAIRLNETNEAADNGTAAHEVLRSLPSTGQIDWESIAEIAARFGADPDETRMLAALGAKLWPAVADSFHGAMTELELRYEVSDSLSLTGHADLLSVSATSIRIGDWKTGRKDRDYSEQLKGYAALALLGAPDIDEATSTILWVRDQEIENYTMRRADLDAWLKRLSSELVEWDGVYRPGAHCAHCPRSHECEAANALIRRDVAIIADREIVARAEAELEQMAPDEIVTVLQKASLVVKYAERVRAAIKAHVERKGEITGAGFTLSIETEERRELDPLAAWPVLEELGFEDDDLARAMDLRISRVEKIVREKAGKGSGAAAVRRLSERLKAAGAVSTKQISKLKERRTP